MTFTSLDTITRSVLLQKTLPLHWYVQFLKYASDCVRELSFDSMQAINSVTLLIDRRDFTVDLPCDYIDWVRVGVPEGQFVRPLVQQDSFNRLTNFTPTGMPTTYGAGTPQNIDFPFWPGFWMFQNIDDLGESVGRLYGFGAALYHNGFKVIRERGQIQLNQGLRACEIVLDYISSGQAISNATRIDPLCQAVVEAYVDWKYKSHSKRFSTAEAEQAFGHYKIELRKFRARKDELTPFDIRQVIYRNYIGTAKT